MRQSIRRTSGLTLIELLVVVAMTAVLLGIGVPSLHDWLLSQRVISTAGEIATDLRFGRSEAISSNSLVAVSFRTSGKGCYTLYKAFESQAATCDCTLGAGNACSSTAPNIELKTYTPPHDGEVSVIGPELKIELYSTAAKLVHEDSGIEILVSAGSGKELKVVTSPGLPHPTVCKPAASKISGYRACP